MDPALFLTLDAWVIAGEETSSVSQTASRRVVLLPLTEEGDGENEDDVAKVDAVGCSTFAFLALLRR